MYKCSSNIAVVHRLVILCSQQPRGHLLSSVQQWSQITRRVFSKEFATQWVGIVNSDFHQRPAFKVCCVQTFGRMLTWGYVVIVCLKGFVVKECPMIFLNKIKLQIKNFFEKYILGLNKVEPRVDTLFIAELFEISNQNFTPEKLIPGRKWTN